MSETQTVDTTTPQGKWTFDDDVTAAFDDMLRRSIPDYETMRAACVDIACKFVRPRTAVVDLGCSRGEAMSELIRRYGLDNHFVGVEVSEPMLQTCRERFAHEINAGYVAIESLDLRSEYPQVQASVTLCVLTLQFTPIEYRLQILKRIYDHTLPGGALILVEKIIGSTATLDQLMVETYYRLKSEHGYSQDQIERKRLSLEGVLVPVTADWNREMLRSAGFTEIDAFWRWFNFAGWVAVKGGAS
jgi:tRNA (cmo5U34)-methyltransferase